MSQTFLYEYLHGVGGSTFGGDVNRKVSQVTPHTGLRAMFQLKTYSVINILCMALMYKTQQQQQRTNKQTFLVKLHDNVRDSEGNIPRTSYAATVSGGEDLNASCAQRPHQR